MKRSLLAALGLIALVGLIAFKTGFVSLDDLFSPPFELAVEVKPLRGEPNSKYYEPLERYRDDNARLHQSKHSASMFV